MVVLAFEDVERIHLVKNGLLEKQDWPLSPEGKQFVEVNTLNNRADLAVQLWHAERTVDEPIQP